MLMRGKRLDACVAFKRVRVLFRLGIRLAFCERQKLPALEIKRRTNLLNLMGVVGGNHHFFHDDSSRLYKKACSKRRRPHAATYSLPTTSR